MDASGGCVLHALGVGPDSMRGEEGIRGGENKWNHQDPAASWTCGRGEEGSGQRHAAYLDNWVRKKSQVNEQVMK